MVNKKESSFLLMSVYYGIQGKEKDVTKIFHNLIRKEQKLLEPLVRGEAGSYCNLLGNPAPGRVKRLKIVRAGKHYYFPEDSPLQLNYIINDYDNFDWVTYIINYPDLNFIKTQVNSIAHLEEYGKREGRILFPLWGKNGSISFSSSKPLFTKLFSLLYTVYLAYYTGRDVIISSEQFSSIDIEKLQNLIKKETKVSIISEGRTRESNLSFFQDYTREQPFSSSASNLIDLILEIKESPVYLSLETPLPRKDVSFYELENKIYSLLGQIPVKKLEEQKDVFLLCARKSKEDILSKVLSFYVKKEDNPLLLRTSSEWINKYTPGIRNILDEDEEFSLIKEAKIFIGLERSKFSCRVAGLRKCLGKISFILREREGEFCLNKE